MHQNWLMSTGLCFARGARSPINRSLLIVCFVKSWPSDAEVKVNQKMVGILNQAKIPRYLTGKYQGFNRTICSQALNYIPYGPYCLSKPEWVPWTPQNSFPSFPFSYLNDPTVNRGKIWNREATVPWNIRGLIPKRVLLSKAYWSRFDGLRHRARGLDKTNCFRCRITGVW